MLYRPCDRNEDLILRGKRKCLARTRRKIHREPFDCRIRQLLISRTRGSRYLALMTNLNEKKHFYYY